MIKANQAAKVSERSGMAQHVEHTLIMSGTITQTLKIAGTITKVSRREGVNRIVLQPEGGRNFICDFDKPFAVPKPRKGQVANVIGGFVSEGYATVCLANCELLDS